MSINVKYISNKKAGIPKYTCFLKRTLRFILLIPIVIRGYVSSMPVTIIITNSSWAVIMIPPTMTAPVISIPWMIIVVG